MILPANTTNTIVIRLGGILVGGDGFEWQIVYYIPVIILVMNNIFMKGWSSNLLVPNSLPIKSVLMLHLLPHLTGLGSKVEAVLFFLYNT